MRASSLCSADFAVPSLSLSLSFSLSFSLSLSLALSPSPSPSLPLSRSLSLSVSLSVPLSPCLCLLFLSLPPFLPVPPPSPPPPFSQVHESHRQNFSKVLSQEQQYCKFTRTLTFENFCHSCGCSSPPAGAGGGWFRRTCSLPAASPQLLPHRTLPGTRRSHT